QGGKLGGKVPGGHGRRGGGGGERVLGGLVCAAPADRVKKYLSFVGRGSPFPAAGLRYAMSDRKSQFIAICMFIGAVTMIGLALIGTPPMRVAPSPVVAVVPQ